MKAIRNAFWRSVLWMVNIYEGARFSIRRSVLQQSLTSARFDMTASTRQELARKMMYFEANNPIVQALAGKFENFVVGANPQLTPGSSNPKWNAAAKRWWDQWSRYCDIASRQNLSTILSLVARSWFLYGECFIILTNGREVNGQRRPRIQILEGHLCKTPPHLEKRKDIWDGVQVDGNGRPLFYYFGREDEQGKVEFGPPVDAEFVIHVFEPSRPGQVRGISFFHSVINELHGLDDLHIMEMSAAAANAERVFTVETANGELSAANVIRSAATRSVQTNTGATATESSQDFYQQALPGGRVVALRRGDKIQQHAGERPSVVTRDYWKYKTELVCAGVEIPMCIVFPDSMQGTVYRGALDMATSFFRSRHTVIAEAVRRIWEYVIGFAVRVDPELNDPLPPDWRNVSILPPRAPNVDVGRNASAEKEALLDGRMNYDLIFAPQGLSAREELKKYDEQLAFIEEECPHLAKLLASNTKNPNPQDGGPVPIKMSSGNKEAIAT